MTKLCERQFRNMNYKTPVTKTDALSLLKAEKKATDTHLHECDYAIETLFKSQLSDKEKADAFDLFARKYRKIKELMIEEGFQTGYQQGKQDGMQEVQKFATTIVQIPQKSRDNVKKEKK